MNNVPKSIRNKFGSGLHTKINHPLKILKDKIYAMPEMKAFKKFDDFPPLVSVEDNFDALLIPKDHPSRRPSDTYYWNEHQVLRTHTSAHQVQLLASGEKQFLVTGDVYRKDDIDATHYPIFHQMEGVRIGNMGSSEAEADLKSTLNGVLRKLFPHSEPIWKKDFFPFTDPSWEVAVQWEGKELEVLGCGLIQRQVLENAEVHKELGGWAFGLGLERLAMVLFKIPDIRLFWSDDRRFLSQFWMDEIIPFKPYSVHPPCLKDISFWTTEGYEKTTFFELVREVGGDLVEEVKEIDSFQKDGRTSRCYRITYRAMDRTFTNQEVDGVQGRLRMMIKAFQQKMGVELR